MNSESYEKTAFYLVIGLWLYITSYFNFVVLKPMLVGHSLIARLLASAIMAMIVFGVPFLAVEQKQRLEVEKKWKDKLVDQESQRFLQKWKEDN
jgi:hypothetical protein